MMDTPIRRNRLSKRALFILVGSGILLILTIFVTLALTDEESLQIAYSRITVATVEQGPFIEYTAVTGTIMPEKTVFITSSEGGKVDAIYVENGAQINQGDPILKLSNTNLQMNYINRESQILEQINTLRTTRIAVADKSLQLREQLLEIEYQLQKATLNYERNQILLSKKAISLAEFEPIREEFTYLKNKRDLIRQKLQQDSALSKFQLAHIEPSLDLMEKNLAYIEKSLDELEIKAPITGQISSLNLEYGQSIGAGITLAQIDVWNGFKIRVGVDEHYIARVSIGQTGVYESAGTSYALRIDKIYPEVRNGKFMVDMVFEKEVPPSVRRGQTLQIKLALSEEIQAIKLKKGSFYNFSGGRYVFVLNKQRTAAYKKNISAGRQNTFELEILEGLSPGDQIITSDYAPFEGFDKIEFSDE